jgi:hypothetical protein
MALAGASSSGYQAISPVALPHPYLSLSAMEKPNIMNQTKEHPCRLWLNCSAGHCPMSNQGNQTEDDEVCSLIPSRFTKEFTKDHQGESTDELTAAIDRLYKKHVIKQTTKQ